MLLILLYLAALEDIKRQPIPTDVRYITCPDTPNDYATISWVINMAVSRRDTLYHPVIVKPGLIRINLSELKCPPEVWELLSTTEPYFTTQLTSKVQTPEYKASDGKTYNFKVKRLPLDPALAILTGSDVPIARHDWLIKRLLTTVDGGLYYTFADIPATQDQFLLKYTGTTEKLAKNDQAYAQFFSDVTAKPRKTILYRGLNGLVGSNTGFVAITQDPKDNAVNPKQHPLRNLIDFQYDATEIILERSNGLHLFALYDAKGTRQDSAPDNIVRDNQVPSPYTSRLNGAISCIRCHAPGDGLQPIQNDVTTILKASKIYAKDTEQLSKIYGTDLSKTLNRARDDYAETIARLATPYNFKILPTPRDLSLHLASIFNTYEYKRINAKSAAVELGIETFDAVGTLPIDKYGIEIEDPMISALRAGLSISRLEWEQVYAEAYLRINAGNGLKPNRLPQPTSEGVLRTSDRRLYPRNLTFTATKGISSELSTP